MYAKIAVCGLFYLILQENKSDPKLKTTANAIPIKDEESLTQCLILNPWRERR